MSPEREREYAELNAYLDWYSTNVSGIDPANPIHPTNVGKRIVAEYGKSKALDGLKQAVNDTVEELIDQPPDYIGKLDETLREAGLLTFSEVRRRYASSYKRILKRGSIKNDTEYYLIAGVLADFTTSADDDERATLGQLISEYERNAQPSE
jgi:hypothetical protein